MTTNTMTTIHDHQLAQDPDDFLRLPSPDQAKDPTLESAFAKALEDDDFHDLTLRCTDQVQIKCSRFVMASRSLVLKKMLLGPFQEGRSDVVNLQFTGAVIHALVEYIHKNNAEILSCSIPDGGTEHRLETLVSLVGAAFFFGFPQLCHMVIESIKMLLDPEPQLLFTVLKACSEQVVPVPYDLRETALSFVWSPSINLHDSSVIGQLTSSVIVDLLGYSDSPMSEHDMFEMLCLWTTSTAEDTNTSQEDRKSFAMEMIPYIDLQKIHPLQLSTQVASSGLVTQDQLCEAYKGQAFAATSTSIDFEGTRGTRVEAACWTRSGSADFMSNERNHKLDYFKSSPMVFGKYRWTFEIVKCYFMSIGIVHATNASSSSQLGTIRGTWSYSHSGLSNQNGVRESSTLPKYATGSKVTMVLDLSNQDSTGTLSASIDGGSEFILFQNLKEHVEAGFVPVASFFGGNYSSGELNQLRILEYKRLK